MMILITSHIAPMTMRKRLRSQLGRKSPRVEVKIVKDLPKNITRKQAIGVMMSRANRIHSIDQI